MFTNIPLGEKLLPAEKRSLFLSSANETFSDCETSDCLLIATNDRINISSHRLFSGDSSFR